MSDIYALVTTRVPFPKTPAFFALLLLSCYSIAMALEVQITSLGLHPVSVAFLCAFALNLWQKMPRVFYDKDPDVAWSVLAVMLLICTAILFAPSLIWLQRGYSVGLIFLICGFVSLYKSDGPNGFPWFARSWRCGKRNAANWHIARYAALIACNEAIIRSGTTTEWIISIAVLPIVMYYLMYWTILATHPYDEDPARYDP